MQLGDSCDRIWRSRMAGLVAMDCLGQLDAAIPVAVLDVAAPKDDQPGLQFLGVEKEGHGGTPVQVLCRVRA